MFGYVTPDKGEMKVREYECYRAVYCGLCMQLKADYGFVSRMLLNYDLVTVALLADGISGEKGSPCMKRCMANPLRRRCMHAGTQGLRLAAASLVLLSWYKLADDLVMAQLVACAPEKPEVMRKDIEDTIDTFQSEALKKIVREMLRLTGDKLEWFPAAQRLHHAERSGLLHHTTSMLNLARHVVAAYPFLNAELLYAGVILHDLSLRKKPHG